ncbi:serine/threonine protein phosphatase [Marinobacter salinus]|uniref:Serine/threonine protein phosphatase n=1 Tax=Marinobacter salinus TaxID=1874317 RepID=A0A1D9GLI1_9GAMM|nr:Stp1/IreP family PP2C-type Ser/Thr phosphatase [Marinobacter salinus]AOY88411.1 serine/threonine protein phosphatase [Marinobacter salinus]
MAMDVAGRSHTGAVRDSNQDVVAWHVNENGSSALMVVADGMGGYQGGEIASRMAVDVVMESLLPEFGATNGEVAGETIRARLQVAFSVANERILDRRASEPRLDKMGTTLVAAWVKGNEVHVAHVGDSRCYLIRGGCATCLTRDDTVVQNMLEDGSITEADVPNVPFRNVLTRAVGSMDPVEISYRSEHLQSGDNLLMCSDGLTNSVPEWTWKNVLNECSSIEDAAQALIDTALENQASDNVSVVLLTLD